MSELSRPSKTGPFGSNDRRLDMLVSESLEEAIITMAAMAIGLAFTLALQRGGKAANNE